MDSLKNIEKPIEIDLAALSPEALTGIIENYILREGTDYGAHEVGYDTKVAQIRRLLDKKDIKIIYDQSSQSVSLMKR